MAMNVDERGSNDPCRVLRQQCKSGALQRTFIWILLGAIAVGAACFFWPAWSRGRLQRARVAALLRFDSSICAQYGAFAYTPPPSVSGSVDGDSFRIVWEGGQKVNGFSVVDEPTGYLSWVAPIFDEHCFAHVTEITVHDSDFSDSDVDLLLAFPKVRAIDVSDTSITDAGLIKLASNEQLVLLNVSGTRVSGQSLREFARCEQLKELDIRDTNADRQVADSLQEAIPGCWVRWE